MHKDFVTLAHTSLPTASLVTDQHLQHRLPFPSSAPASAVCLLAPSTAYVRYRAILAQFPEVENPSKRLPTVHQDVVHHIVTDGLLINCQYILGNLLFVDQGKQTSNRSKQTEFAVSTFKFAAHKRKLPFSVCSAFLT